VSEAGLTGPSEGKKRNKQTNSTQAGLGRRKFAMSNAGSAILIGLSR
jgi:hypothetical protein